ncbi:hypothetical protein GYMC10_4419 [Paenibacillus sp. Y412MC10]|nr:hypothetical protein GYMC10_4419 [Paenibacillus sp. Y412MC10]ETT60820.1 hypothetical protein C172_21053 [Paenibacillus sp. FSL H8-457]
MKYLVTPLILPLSHITRNRTTLMKLQLGMTPLLTHISIE